VAAVLPEGLQAHRPAANTQLMRQTLLSTEQGLSLTTRFSLLMAFFIIINTFFMNITERRRHLSIMRAIGATRGQIRRALMGEAVLLGVVGTAVGLLFGVALAFVGSNMVARAFDVQLPRLVEVMTIWPFVTGAMFGMGTALVGAFFPAILAGRVSPLEGMNRSAKTRPRSTTALMFITGLIMTLISVGLIFGSILGYIKIDRAADFAIVFLIGLVLLNAVALVPQAGMVAALIKPFFPVESKLALKQVLRHQMRSVLTMGVLFIVGSSGVGLANSILDCVKDIHEWFDQAIVADYVVRAMMPDMATGTAADLPEALGEELAKVPHVLAMDEVSFVQADVPWKGPDGADTLQVIVIARKYIGRRPDEPPNFDLITGERSQLREQLLAGKVVVGSVLAQKLNIDVGDKIPLQTKEGLHEFELCGVANEYMVGGLAVHMHREQAARWMGVTGVDGYMLHAEEGYREAMKPELERIGRKYDVFVLSHGDLRKNVNRIVAGTEWSLWLLVVMGYVVAAFGIVNTLTMNVLEQTRELGLLRIVAMTKKQVRRTIEAQALIIGGVGLPQGIAMGVFMAYVLNLAMMPSIGHPIDFHLHHWMLLGTFLGASVIVLVAAFIPARRATQINVVEALHYE
jgi:putative ABC transport system permease protein